MLALTLSLLGGCPSSPGTGLPPSAEEVVEEQCKPVPGLAFVSELVFGAGGTVGMGGPTALAMAPDGRFLYVASRYGDSLTAYARDPVTEEVVLVQSLRDGMDGVDSLREPIAVWISEDATQLLVGGLEGLTAFEIADDGPLTRAWVFKPPHYSGNCEWAVIDILPALDDTQILLQSTDEFVLCKRDPGGGELEILATWYDEDIGGVDLARGEWHAGFAPDGRHLYLSGVIDYEEVGFATCAIEQASHHLICDEVTDPSGDSTLSCAGGRFLMPPDGKTVVLADSGAICLFSRDGGRLAAVGADCGAYDSASNDYQPGAVITTYTLDPADPSLHKKGVVEFSGWEFESWSDWAGVGLTTGKGWLAVTSQFSPAGVAMTTNPLMGMPTFLGGLFKEGPNKELRMVNEIFVGEGDDVLAVSREEFSLAVYDIQRPSGMLKLKQKLDLQDVCRGVDDGWYHWRCRLAPTAARDAMYELHKTESGELRFSTIERGEDGQWTWVWQDELIVVSDEHSYSIGAPVFSPDDTFMLGVSGGYDDTVIVRFERDPVDGWLTYDGEAWHQEKYLDLFYLWDLTISPDGTDLYGVGDAGSIEGIFPTPKTVMRCPLAAGGIISECTFYHEKAAWLGLTSMELEFYALMALSGWRPAVRERRMLAVIARSPARADSGAENYRRPPGQSGPGGRERGCVLPARTELGHGPGNRMGTGRNPTVRGHTGRYCTVGGECSDRTICSG